MFFKTGIGLIPGGGTCPKFWSHCETDPESGGSDKQRQ